MWCKTGNFAYIFLFSSATVLAVFNLRLHRGKHDVSTRIGLVIFEVIWKMRLFFNGEHWSFHLEPGYDLHTFFQNLRNNDKKRKAQIGNSFRIKEENIQGIQTFKYKGERFDHIGRRS